MTKPVVDLRVLLEKSGDADLPRETSAASRAMVAAFYSVASELGWPIF